ncbi:hypothetical protein PILCRDRAFT_553182 [Piloderma croceum F 1598]|uniref:Uncharacterized protein n=1 Tax=Piloderma croceum (strain F 1598) TaxID=765440 RepID=A0A0C3F4T6_PILCF|nr:hypothetical protein PILCRDRAFT_553182 [Piloderma croceum F 1598]
MELMAPSTGIWDCLKSFVLLSSIQRISVHLPSVSDSCQQFGCHAHLCQPVIRTLLDPRVFQVHPNLSDKPSSYLANWGSKSNRNACVHRCW